MASIFTQSIGAILNNYADVIEGGNTWRGSGDAYRGIPGTYSNDDGLRGDTPADTPLTVVGSSVSTTTFDVASSYSWDSARWIKSDTPAFWALCTTSGAAGNPNIDQARKITGYNNTTHVFTVAPALSAAPVASDVFAILQGFKRLPNQLDIEAEDSEIGGGFDRFFQLEADAGEQLEWFGNGTMTFKTEMVLRLRFLKYGRSHDVAAAALENLMMIRAVLARGASPDHRDGTYTRAMFNPTGAPEPVKDDKTKIVLEDRYPIVYRVNTTFA